MRTLSITPNIHTAVGEPVAPSATLFTGGNRPIRTRSPVSASQVGSIVRCSGDDDNGAATSLFLPPFLSLSHFLLMVARIFTSYGAYSRVDGDTLRICERADRPDFIYI